MLEVICALQEQERNNKGVIRGRDGLSGKSQENFEGVEGDVGLRVKGQ